jgi:hypothetical protein
MTDTTTKLSIGDLAAIAFDEFTSAAERQGDEMFEQHRDEFLTCARAMAHKVLGHDAAAQLNWQYTGTMHLPKDTEEATAWIDEGPAYLRYRATDEEVSFELVQPCSACGHKQINGVSSLAVLGGLLECATLTAEEQAAIA